MKKTEFTTQKVFLALLCVLLLVLAQLGAVSIGDLLFFIGIPEVVVIIMEGIIYVMVVLAGSKLLCNKGLNLEMKTCKITKFRLKYRWIVSAFLMPFGVCVVLLLTKGNVVIHFTDQDAMITILIGGIFFFGVATGIVEEVVFRGIIMTALELRFNKKVAILAPSMLFGLLHMIGNELDFVSKLQLFVAGTLVGILFSLVTYESGSIWNSAFMHAIWNTIMIGGILNIGIEADLSIINYVLDTKSFLLSGGDFGIEASIVSIVFYLFFSGLALLSLKAKVQPKIAKL